MVTPVAWMEQPDPEPVIDLDDIDARAREVNLGPWRPGVGIVHCIPALVEELREARAKIVAIADLHSPADSGAGLYCAGCRTHVTYTPWPCATARLLGGAE